MKKLVSAVLISTAASFAYGAALAQAPAPAAQPEYTAEDVINAFAAQPEAAAPAAADGACAEQGMVAGDDGVCEPAKDTRGFSLPTRATMNDPAKGDTRGFSLPNRTATSKSNTRGFSLPPAQQRTQPARAATTTPRRATAPNRAQGTRVASAPRPTAASASAVARRDLLISFESGSAQLTQQGQANAKVFAEALKSPQLSAARFEIQGHTDASGSREQNLLLSQRRAEAVRQYLISLGVEPSRLEARGFGFDQLAAPTNPRASENRRVEASRLN